MSHSKDHSFTAKIGSIKNKAIKKLSPRSHSSEGQNTEIVLIAPVQELEDKIKIQKEWFEYLNQPKTLEEIENLKGSVQNYKEFFDGKSQVIDSLSKQLRNIQKSLKYSTDKQSEERKIAEDLNTQIQKIEQEKETAKRNLEKEIAEKVIKPFSSSEINILLREIDERNYAQYKEEIIKQQAAYFLSSSHLFKPGEKPEDIKIGGLYRGLVGSMFPNSLNKIGTMLLGEGDTLKRHIGITIEILENKHNFILDKEICKDIFQNLIKTGCSAAIAEPEAIADLIAADLAREENTEKKLAPGVYTQIAALASENIHKYEAFLKSDMAKLFLKEETITERQKILAEDKEKFEYFFSTQIARKDLFGYIIQNPDSKFYRMERALTVSPRELDGFGQELHNCLTNQEVNITPEQSMTICKKISLMGCGVMLAFPEEMSLLIKGDFDEKKNLPVESYNKISEVAKTHLAECDLFLEKAKKFGFTTEEDKILKNASFIESANKKINGLFPRISDEHPINRTDSIESLVTQIAGAEEKRLSLLETQVKFKVKEKTSSLNLSV